MKKQIKEDWYSLEGKTIKNIEWFGGNLGINFTDDTFIFLLAKEELYYEPSIIITIQESDIELHDERLFDLGVITKQEREDALLAYEAKQKEFYRKCKEDTKRNELALLAELKAKYE